MKHQIAKINTLFCSIDRHIHTFLTVISNKTTLKLYNSKLSTPSQLQKAAWQPLSFPSSCPLPPIPFTIPPNLARPTHSPPSLLPLHLQELHNLTHHLSIKEVRHPSLVPWYLRYYSFHARVSPSLVKRRKTHFHQLPIGASIILGNNGLVWLHPSREEEGGGKNYTNQKSEN